MTRSHLFFQFLVIIMLTGINAFFSGAEMAIVSINKNKLKMLVEDGNKRAIMLDKLLEEPSKFLSTIQVGITLAGFFASASAATGISKYFSSYLQKLNIPYSNQISMILITLLLSYITLVFGELIPKRLALRKSEKIALFSIGIIITISKIFSPFVKFLTFSTNTVLSLLKMKDDNLEEKVSKEEIRSLVEVGREHGIINDIEKEMIENIIEFDEKIAREIMIPRTKVFLVDKNITIEELFAKKEIGRYSRIPVYDGEADNIIGVLFTKELMMEAYKKGFENVILSDILQEVYFVPETKNVNELFNELQIEKKHIAMLIDEYGGFSGIVTLEDLIEEVMGNIYDEYDAVDSSIKKLSTDKYLVNGELFLNDINDYFDIELDSKHYDTLSGLLIEKIGYIPEDNEDIPPVIIGNLSFKPQRVKDKKIEKILIIFNNLDE
ncbi:MAG: HlyC/CorC family transporter [Leptotrichiaceae bacterium]|nr:HlyC/CorC family transporter [Leptotrichiaceae bacterium]MBP6280929.1 HlyC/CorC family transporter [Leptotrichiaceae bacterium]MBP7100588.1 HlyC/CorC family transporter [Leptotrichiaceae bacterium]MBP7739352.1 HlyC/CorC family transporter [Leptotrichiaceae bacterium]MBP9629340.1 HlyC/CorC family transporter [Leptotrichiaceae bacterium]